MTEKIVELWNELGVLIKGARLLSEEVAARSAVCSPQEDLADTVEDAAVVMDRLRPLLMGALACAK
ncbi:hypothetical protein ILFOPFJJ_01474 [Ensifer psoraleae]|uniref:hypothetical protein n=1 Tax=Sinorhizobium psoraleae TaxID=520838 RepID=UPI001567CB87|nr:hypothetical protein [Sinorhizobium psoraleae]NRP70593.1 hypothetical protein [Sinorhizobium psoraleae]